MSTSNFHEINESKKKGNNIQANNSFLQNATATTKPRLVIAYKIKGSHGFKTLKSCDGDERDINRIGIGPDCRMNCDGGGGDGGGGDGCAVLEER